MAVTSKWLCPECHQTFIVAYVPEGAAVFHIHDGREVRLTRSAG